MKRKNHYTWEKFDKDCRKLAKIIRKEFKTCKSIYGIPRGGLVVAVQFSHLLGLPLEFNTQKITPKTLVVDDIVDSGQTLKKLIKKIGYTPKSASLFWNKKSAVTPTWHIVEKKKWVIFPWETSSSSKYDGTLR